MLSTDNFSTWILNELEKRNMSQSELAQLTGLSRGALSHLISGTRGRGPDNIDAIARALKLPPELVFRMAGLIPAAPGMDAWIETMNYKLNAIRPSDRQLAEKIIDAFLQETKPAPVSLIKKSRAKT